MNKLEKLGCWLCIFLLMFSADAMGTRAEEQELGRRQIVFLLDESDSMRGELWGQALDEIAMVVAALPPEYEAALITYNDDVNNVIDFGSLSVDAVNEFRKTQPKGYTNTGIALQKVLGQFSGTADEKQIIIISDGEICARGKGETEKALELYYETVEKAVAQNVKIDVLLFQTGKVEDQISRGAAETGGFVFEKTKQDTAPLFALNFLFERLGINIVMLGTWDSFESAMDISLQNTFAERVKIFLASEEHIEDIKVSCQSRNVTVAQGERFAVIDLNRPVESNVVLQYILSEKGKVNAYLIKEYSLSADISSTYEAATRQHTFRISITDADGENVLADAGFCEKMAVYLNGNRTDYTIEQGNAVIPCIIEESQEVAVRVDFDDPNGIVSCKGAENSLFLELPPLPESEEEGIPYLWVYVAAAGVALLFVLLLTLFILAKKKTKIPQKVLLRRGEWMKS